MEELLDTYHHVSIALANNGDKLDPEWDEQFWEMGRIVLAERSQFRAELAKRK
jgi:hypothetical protein